MRNHVSPERLTAYLKGEEELSFEDEVALSLHLEEGCEACWSAQAALPPSDPAECPRLLGRALLRLRYRPSRIPLRSAHMDAVRRAGPAAEPGELRFVSLVVEEAFDQGDPPQLEPVWPVAFDAPSRWPALPNLLARATAWASVVRRRQADVHEADLALELAERYLLLGDGSPAVEAEVERARAWSFLPSEPDRVFEHLGRSMGLLAGGEASRRFELRAETLLVYTSLSGRGKVPPAAPDRLLRAIEATLGELRAAERHSDPIERCRAFYSKARFATFLPTLARAGERGEDVVSPLSRSLAEELELGLHEFHEVAGELLTEQVCGWLGELAVSGPEDGLPRESGGWGTLEHVSQLDREALRVLSRAITRNEVEVWKGWCRRTHGVVREARRILESLPYARWGSR